MTSSMKAAIHFGPDFHDDSELHKNMKFENIENVFNIIQKMMKEQSEEILNVKTLDYQSPSWTISTIYNDKVIEWAKAKVCFYADSAPGVGKKEQNPGAAPFQGAVGLDGEPIEFEWKDFPFFTTLTLLRDIQMDLARKNIQ